jgi:hypothetical protein
MLLNINIDSMISILITLAIGVLKYTKIKNKEMVPSQDYVLQDNKRCYDKILSDWNFRPPSNVFW